MSSTKVLDLENCLTVDESLIKKVLQHVTFLASFRYRPLIEKLQFRHIGYEKEDFIQDVMSSMVKILNTKKFPTMNHLKSFINKTMQFHYIYEKRRLYDLKKNNKFTQISLNKITEDNDSDIYSKQDLRLLEDCYNKYDISLDNLEMKLLLDKKLYINIVNEEFFIIKAEDLFNVRSGYIIPVKYFLEKQYEIGKFKFCGYLKKNHELKIKKVFLYEINKKLKEFLAV